MVSKSESDQPDNSIQSDSNKSTAQRKIRLAIAEDFINLQDALIKSFSHEPEIEIVLMANNGEDLLAKLKVLNQLPDIVLMDIRMPVMNGIVATDRVLAEYPSIKVIAFSVYDNKANIIDMYMHGAKGFVAKDRGFSEVAKAIKMVRDGHSYVTSEALEVIQHYLKKIKLTEDQKITLDLELANQLSTVELKILYHTAQFKSLKQLSELLCKSPATINNQQATIRSKLGLKGRKSLLQFAVLQIETIKYLLKIAK